MVTATAPFSTRPNVRGRLEVYQESQDIAGNYSVVRIQLYAEETSQQSSFSNNAEGPWAVSVNSVNWSNTWSFNFTPGGNQQYLLLNTTLVVPHNADGTKTLVAAAYIPGGPLGRAPGSGTMDISFALTTIPRASNPTQSPNPCEYGQLMTINTNRASSGFTHTINWTFGTQSGTLGTGIGASTTWTPPLSLLNEFPNSVNGVGTFTTYTYNGSTLIGTSTVSFTLAAPSTIVPTFTTVTHSEGTAGVAANIGGYVQSISRLVLALTGASSVYGATIVSQKIEILSGATVLQTINAASGTSTPVNASGTVVLRGTVTDSRGRTAVKTINVTFLAWAPPVINAASVQRATSLGVVDENGLYLRVNINALVSSLIVGTQKNALVYKISTRVRGTSTWTLKDTVTPGGVTFNSFRTIGTYSLTDSYDILIEVLDDFATSALQITIAVAKVFMHWDGSLGVGIGKYREDGTLDVDGDVWVRQDLVVARFLKTDRVPSSGTTAERNSLYPLPSTDIARVALANRRIRWFNTDLGWEEAYYAPAGLSGLTARALKTGTAAGWYPVAGSGLHATRGMTSGYTATPAGGGVNPPLDAGYHFGPSIDSGIAGVVYPIAGKFRVQADVYFSGGSSGTYLTYARISVNGVLKSSDIDQRSLNLDIITSVTDILEVPASHPIAMYGLSSSVSNMYGVDGRQTRLSVEYLSPLFA